MNILCTICNDLVNPSESIFVTKCGHIFHHHCLAQWLERSLSCPQCRSRVSGKDMFRIYPTLADSVPEDAAALQSKLDTANLQLREHKQAQIDLNNKIFRAEVDLKTTKTLLSTTELRLICSESTSETLRIQMQDLKHVEREKQHLKEENLILRKRLDKCAAVQRVLNENNAEAEEIITTYPDIKSVAMFATALKRALTETELKWRSSRAELSLLESKSALLRTKYTYNKEKLVQLRQQYEELRKRKAEEEPQGHNKRRLLNDSPINDDVEEFSVIIDNNISDIVNQEEECEVVRDIKSTNSPYLRLRTGGPAQTFKPSEISTMKSMQSNSQFSIFTNKRGGVSGGVSNLPLRGGPIGGAKEEARFDGLGGHSVPEVFPRSRPKLGVKHRLKRFNPASPAKTTSITEIFSKLK